MGVVGGQEGNAGQATEVNSDAGFYSGEDAGSAMTAINGEEGDGMGVGIFDLKGRRISSSNLPFDSWNPTTNF